MKLDSKTDYRKRRHLRLRKQVKGSTQRPRMSLFISNKHMYVQFIDDEQAVTLAAVSTVEKDFAGASANKIAAEKLGKAAAERATAKGISEVVFDRGGFQYEGRVKILAEAAREAGLKF